MKAPPLEKAFQAKVTKKLKCLANTWFVKVSDRAKSGIPDILLCVRGNFVALELKRCEKSKATPLQVYTIDQIASANGIACVVHPGNWETVWRMLVTIAGGVKHNTYEGEK